MKQDNDMTIFKYLYPFENDMLSSLKDRDIREILEYINKYYLEYRDSIGILKKDTFGIEIEIENFKGSVFDLYSFEKEISKLINNSGWIVKNDITLFWGREISSRILSDNFESWKEVRQVCEYASKYGEINARCGGHVHIGSQILGNNTFYWYRFFKLWTIYENVIYRFAYGEYLSYRDNILGQAKPVASFYNKLLSEIEKMLDLNLYNILCKIKPKDICLESMKKFGISYFYLINNKKYEPHCGDYDKLVEDCTLEIRCSAGTLDEIIWQNYINFFTKLMLYCKRDDFNDDILDRRKLQVEGIYSDILEYNKVYLEQALELADLIFDNNLDKIYFLRQYIKSFEVVDKPFVKARKFTCCTR